jgi:stage V sporulation protein G
MEITEVRIKLTSDTDDRLQAFCSITLDGCFVIRDLKIIEGSNGYFVAMPSRKMTFHCYKCRYKNHLRAAFCNQCGVKLCDEKPGRDGEGRLKLYADIAHPVNSACRDMIQTRVISTFKQELERSKLPGYVSNYDDDYLESDSGAATTSSGLRSAEARPESAHDEHRGPHKTQTDSKTV